jgi:hypothetical protein
MSQIIPALIVSDENSEKAGKYAMTFIAAAPGGMTAHETITVTVQEQYEQYR